MLHRLALVLAAIAFGLGIFISAAHAQGVVVAACGTPPATYPVGSTIPFFIDQTTGNLCTAASIGSVTIGSVTQGTGNIANPWYVLAGTGGVDVNCISGCSAGSFNNNADSVGTSTTNGQAAAWPYLWNGSSWDRWYGDKTNGGFVNVKTSVLPTGAATSSNQSAIITALGSPFQAGGSIGNTTFAATQSGTWAVRTQDGSGNALSSTASALDVNLKSGSIANTSFAVTNAGVFAVQNPTLESAIAPLKKRMNVNISSMSPFISLSTNLTRVGNQAFALGPQLSKAALPVTMATDQVGAAGTPASIAFTVQGISGGTPVASNLTQLGSNTLVTAGVNGTLATGGNQAAGSTILSNTFPMLVGGSDYSGTPNIQNWKVDTGGSGYVNCSNCTGSGVSQTDEATFIPGTSSFATSGGFYQYNPLLNPLTNLQMGVYQLTATRAIFTNLRDAVGNEWNASNPLPVQNPYLQQKIVAALQSGLQWSSKSLSVVLARDQRRIPVLLQDGKGIDATDSKAHAIVVSPFAPRSQNWTGAQTSSDGSAHTLAASLYGQIFVTGLQCFRTDAGSTMDYLTLSDTASTPIALPPLGGSNVQYATPLRVAAGTALTFTVAAAISSVQCAAQGYYAQN